MELQTGALNIAHGWSCRQRSKRGGELVRTSLRQDDCECSSSSVPDGEKRLAVEQKGGRVYRAIGRHERKFEIAK